MCFININVFVFIYGLYVFYVLYFNIIFTYILYFVYIYIYYIIYWFYFGLGLVSPSPDFKCLNPILSAHIFNPLLLPQSPIEPFSAFNPIPIQNQLPKPV